MGGQGDGDVVLRDCGGDAGVRVDDAGEEEDEDHVEVSGASWSVLFRAEGVGM